MPLEELFHKKEVSNQTTTKETKTNKTNKTAYGQIRSKEDDAERISPEGNFQCSQANIRNSERDL